MSERKILVGLYGLNGECFNSIAINSKGEYICVGDTRFHNVSGNNVVIMKLNTKLNLIKKQRFTGDSSDFFQTVVIDKHDDIFVVGHTTKPDEKTIAIIAKFDSELNLIKIKRYGSDYGCGYFNGICIDQDNNLIAVGDTTTGHGDDNAIIVKFDTDLRLIRSKLFGGKGNETFVAVTYDSSGNLICVGSTRASRKGSGYHRALIVKFDRWLEYIDHKTYRSTGGEQLNDVAVRNNDIYCIGTTASRHGNVSGLIMRITPELDMVAKKKYSGNGIECFSTIALTSDDNIVVVGDSSSNNDTMATANISSAIVVVFNKDLTVVGSKRGYGKCNNQYLGVVVERGTDNIVCVGHTEADGNSALIVKFKPTIPTGLFKGKLVRGITLGDTKLKLNDIKLESISVPLSCTSTTLGTITSVPIQKVEAFVEVRRRTTTVIADNDETNL